MEAKNRKEQEEFEIKLCLVTFLSPYITYAFLIVIQVILICFLWNLSNVHLLLKIFIFLFGLLNSLMAFTKFQTYYDPQVHTEYLKEGIVRPFSKDYSKLISWDSIIALEKDFCYLKLITKEGDFIVVLPIYKNKNELEDFIELCSGKKIMTTL